MTRALIHRGPDDEGYFIAGALGLGFRRLSIIDLEGGNQPMSDLEETVWVVCNGEIYNFSELRIELEGYGHIFRSKSDIEVIIHGYKQWGSEVLNRLYGMFGAAIWDAERRRLILARDAMGIKPVYYKLESNSLKFGSEIRAILQSTNEKPEVDPVAVNLFLRYRYTPSPLTVYKGIRKLAPGNMLVLENGICRLERWYRFRPVPFSPMVSAGRAQAELLEIYKLAVKRHLLSDVPLGLLLSGGLDSGLLLGLMSLHRQSWPTFTVGYGKTFSGDELGEAAETARFLTAQNVSVELNRETFEASLAKIVSILEEPIASSSIVPMYFVCERARQDVKVALMGQGPDELFGGYRRHIGLRYGAYWRALPRQLRSALQSAVNYLPRSETLKRGVYSLGSGNRLKRYQKVFSIQPGTVIDGLFQEDILHPETGDKILECWEELTPIIDDMDELSGFQCLEIRSSLPDELLMYADKISMAHGLEVRVPYLDREIVEYVERLGCHLKIRNGSGKWLHRQICNKFLPASILKRRKKGFAVNVVDEWFTNSLSRRMEDMLLDSDSLMFRYLKQKHVEDLLREHKDRKRDNHKVLFSLVVLEQWSRIAYEGNVS